MAVGDGARLASAASARSKVVQTATHIRYVYPARGAIPRYLQIIDGGSDIFPKRSMGPEATLMATPASDELRPQIEALLVEMNQVRGLAEILPQSCPTRRNFRTEGHRNGAIRPSRSTAFRQRCHRLRADMKSRAGDGKPGENASRPEEAAICPAFPSSGRCRGRSLPPGSGRRRSFAEP